ncbi:MAG: carbohydrate-binding domain-containing protein [Oscillospiraceae bacterium]|jgi:hypothetical protein|nr:carbohydrate-binding domain-containing protein [Oscillospiraceae bacterium]
MKKYLFAMLILTLLLTGCASKTAAVETPETGAPAAETASPAAGAFTVNGEAAAKDGVATITAPGTYVVSGTLADGQLVIAADKDDEIFITLDGADITNKSGAAIYASHGLVTLTLAPGTQNTLTDGGADFAYADADKEEPNAALFSKDNLTITGTGALTVNAGFLNGVGSKDDLTIDGGSITVTAAQDGLHAGDNLTVSGGALTVSAGDDGIHADTELTVSGGEIQVLASYEGLEAANVNISGGDISVVSSDDGINAAGGSDGETTGGGFGRDAFAVGDYSINVSGGSITVQAGGDGLDSNGTINISGGYIVSLINSRANGALDANGAVTVTGGTVIYGGTEMEAHPGADSTQSYAYTDVGISADTPVILKKDGKTLIEFTPFLDCRYLAFSSPEIVSGESYEIYSGETLLATVTAGVGGGGGFGFGGGQRPGGDFGGFADGELPSGEFGERPPGGGRGRPNGGLGAPPPDGTAATPPPIPEA